MVEILKMQDHGLKEVVKQDLRGAIENGLNFQRIKVVEVRAAYGSDVRLFKKVLLEIAKKQKGVLNNPGPFVLVDKCGESALVFCLYFFINDSFVDPKIKWELRFEIEERFRFHKIRIPLPQREIHSYSKSNLLTPTENE